MKNEKKLVWSKPKSQTIKETEVKRSVLLSACSMFTDCRLDMVYIDSLPGFDTSTI